MVGCCRDAHTSGREEVRASPMGSIKVQAVGEFFADLEQSAVGPITEPVQHASVEQSRGSGCSIFETVGGWVHSENDVKVAHYLLREPFIKFVIWVQHQTCNDISKYMLSKWVTGKDCRKKIKDQGLHSRISTEQLYLILQKTSGWQKIRLRPILIRKIEKDFICFLKLHFWRQKY